MACDSVTVAVAVLFGPIDDVISQQELSDHILIFSKEEAIEKALVAVREHFEERLSEGNAFKVYMAVEKRDDINDNNMLEEFNGEEF